MAYSKGKNRTSSRSFNPKNAGNRNRIKRKKVLFPTSPINPKANQLAPQKIVRRVEGSPDRFEVFDDELTPFARACLIESEKEAAAEYTLRDDFDYSLGSISIKPADKNRIASDFGTDDGLSQVPTEKVIRNINGIILSNEDSENNGEKYIIANARFVFADLDFERVVDTEISELAFEPKPLLGPNRSPIIIDTMIYPGHGTLDGTESDGYSIQTLIEIGEPAYLCPANHARVIVCDAYSYIDNNGERVDDDLTYTWRFTAVGIGTAQEAVVADGPVLRLYNVQLQQRGRYTCEVSNEKGSSFTKAFFFHPHGGMLKAVNKDGIPTGKWIRDKKHDATHKSTHGYIDYDLSRRRWFKAIWNDGEWIEDPTYNITTKTNKPPPKEIKPLVAPVKVIKERNNLLPLEYQWGPSPGFIKIKNEGNRPIEEFTSWDRNPNQSRWKLKNLLKPPLDKSVTGMAWSKKEKPLPAGGGKIICTELCEQGLLPRKVLELDYQHSINCMDMDTKVGYWKWSGYVVDAMKKSKIITHLVKPIGVAWAYEMAHREEPENYSGDLFGKLIMLIGVPICRYIGKKEISNGRLHTYKI